VLSIYLIYISGKKGFNFDLFHLALTKIIHKEIKKGEVGGGGGKAPRKIFQKESKCG